MTAKVCTRCDEAKSFDSFNKRARSKDGLTASCKDCIRSANDSTKNERARRFYANNAERMRKEARVRRALNPEKGRKAAREYYAANKELCRERMRAWVVANPDKAAEYAAARKAERGSAAVGSVSFRYLRVLYKGCYLCGEPLSGSIHMDHVIPLSRGGAHSMWNLRPTHEECNLRKKDHFLSDLEWYSGPTDLGQVSPQHQLATAKGCGSD